MTHDEILQALYDHTPVGDGLEPERMLYDGLIPSLEEVGARFERGDYFVPEMLIAARAMQGALDILRPLLAETGAQQVGTFLMGTVKGDVHDIGKNLCNIMLEGAGFTVIDLGVNVAPEKFVSEIEQHEPDIVGFSAFLTTTMPMFKANLNALQKAGLRDSVIVMVGGAPVTQEYADAVIGHGRRFCLIGERINPTGRRIFQEQLRAGDLSAVERDVIAQVEGGADVLDVNMGVPMTDEPELLAQAIQMVQSLTDLPICIDSSVVEALEAGLSVYQGRALVNSITAEDERMEQILPLVKRYDAAVIALPNDHDEIPMEADKR